MKNIFFRNSRVVLKEPKRINREDYKDGFQFPEGKNPSSHKRAQTLQLWRGSITRVSMPTFVDVAF